MQKKQHNMKNMHKNRSGGESCSCTTCVYKSESDHLSLRRIVDLGSRIDRLYYGKYIPLRERKLLERLVRTRAVYDDIRAKLVSDSTLSLSTKGDYNPRKKVSVRELDDTERSSGAVLQLVNIVDRGAIGSKKLEDCCSCCSCSSKIKIHEHRHRQRRTYAGAEEYLARQRRLREAYHRKKGVRFKTKHIRSDPCTCTFKLIKKHSKAIYNKMHPRPYVPLFDLQPDEEIKQNRTRIGEVASTSYQNLIDSNTRMKERISRGISKLRESQIRIQEKISMEKFNRAKGKLISKARTGAQKISDINESEFQLGPENDLAFQLKKDSISKFKEELRRKQIMKDWECEPECIEETCVPEECFIRIEQKNNNWKNIHHKAMNHNIRTQERKTGEPLHQSYYKIKAQKLQKAKTIGTNNPTLRVKKTRGIKGSLLSLEKAPKKIQKLGVTNVADKKRNKTRELKVIHVTAKPEKISVENVKVSHPAKNTKLENSSLERKSSQRQAVRIGSSFSFNVEFYKDKPGPKIPGLSTQSFTDSKQTPGIDSKNKKHIKEKETKKRQQRYHSSQIELKKSLKDTKTGGHPLKRCFCTLKLKVKAKKSTISRSVTKKMMTTEQSGLIFNRDVQTNTANNLKKDNTRTKLNLLPYECEPGVCVPGQCDPYHCIKLINIREAKRRNSSTQARETRSTSSFTSKSYKPSKVKNVQSKVTYRGKASKLQQRIKRGNAISNSHRRAVRIGSTFSFNVEFYKDKPKYQQATISPSQIKSFSIIPKKKDQRKVKLKNRGYQGNLGNLRRNTPTQMIKKDRNARIGTTLRRCFCTLSLQKKYIIKDHDTKTLTTGTETSKLKPIDTASKSTKTKLKYSRTLKPYECEPYTCVPGVCDPYMCLERINMRKTRKKEIGAYRHKTPIEPYECEPFTCTPGECDPYVCLERINKRNKHLKEVGLTTNHSQITSRSSGNAYPDKFLRDVKVQYKPRYKVRKVSAKTRKAKRFGLTTNHSQITSSSSGNAYPDKFLRDVKVQYKPRYKVRKVSAKTRKAKRFDEISNKKKYDISKYPTSAKSRQALKISSTFSFDIEFYKNNKSPTQKIKQIYPAEKITRPNNSKISINKGIKMNKLNVAQVESQVQGPMKRDKGSLVGPLLKRCFCTLNLQKKWKNQYFKKETFVSRFLQPPRVYTVNRAMIGYTKSIAHNKNLTDLHNNSNNNFNRNQHTKTTLALQHKDNIDVYKTNNKFKPINVKSDIYAGKQNFEMSQQCKSAYRFHSHQCVEQLEKFVEDTVNTRGFTRNCSLSSQIHETRLTSLTRYFRRCFYTMNLKIENRGNYKELKNNGAIQRKRHKLLPYECEPGICIPGECDPSECQKMIAKRLMKSSSKKSGTRYSSHSMSSTANQPFSKSKEYKQQTLQKKANRSHVFREKSRVYTKTAKNNKKKAVRLGSTFSFNIEISKNLSNAQKKKIVPKYSSDTNLAKHVKHSFKSEGTSERKRNPITRSQSALIKTVNRGAFTNRSMKRCFCTLKLQKKGRLHKEIENQQQLILLNELNKEKMVSRGQNTKKVKPLKLTHVLEPYECEPNVCIPGQCDPYQCLERIKKRSYQEEDFGVNTILPDTKSVSSMITDYQLKKNHRSRSIGVKPKHVTITEKNGKSYREPSHPKPSREAVRIGSSFNFNIEFFKDRPSHPYPTNTYVKGETKENKYSRDPSTYMKKPLDNFTQNKINMRHKRSQFENIARHASTLTNSFIKRCFCTAQLYKSKNANIPLKSDRNKNSPSFVKRCFCVLKKLKPRITNTVKDVKPKETKDKMINTRKMKDNPKLEQYECKPGICVPGECDPYICDKIMRRYRNKNSKATLVDSIKKRSISSSSHNINKRQKSVQTVMKRKDYHNRRTKGKIVETTSINKPNATSWRPDKNVVRIGSKFSFDIEFFKDHPSKINHINQRSVTHKAKSVKDTHNKKKVKKGSTKTISPSYISQSSQVTKKAVKDRGIGINNFIKRCFCTLKLSEKNYYRHKSKTKEIDDDHISKKVSTKSVMTVDKNKLLRNALLPYECEPNTCIPYQCDPYECKKLIKLRHKNQVNREFGVSTSFPGQVSAYSLTDSKKLKTSSQSIMTKKLYQRVKHTPYIIDSDTGKIGQSKQTVKIGSTFSFNIDFIKDKHNDGIDLQKLPKKDHYRREHPKNQGRGQEKHSNQTNHGSKNKNTHQTQFNKNLMNTNKTQFVNPVMRTQSTMTNYAPNKRCFCTLSLKKSKVKPPVSVKTLHASTETDVLKKPTSNLLPYECEPNVCVPYECNPVQCMERIKKRHGMLLPFECEPNVCVPGECNPVQCLEIIKKRHKARGTAMIESQINTFGTAMEESQTRNAATIMKKENRKNKTAQPKQVNHFNRKNVHEQKTDSGINRQAVRIGSNFSFDIEFFKTDNANNMGVTELPKPNKELPQPRKTKHQLKNKAAYGNFEGKNPRSRASQSFSPKKVSHGSPIGPFLKRCFCTKKLQKSQVSKIPIKNKQILTEIKPQQRNISSDNKSTATRKSPMDTYRPSPFECEPFYCVPGECNPYECAKIIKMREKKHKTQYTITQSHTRSQKGVGVIQHNKNSRRSQASFIDKKSAGPKSIISRPEIVEIPRFTNIFNKQAVRIGSNFSFNLEFYKENLPIKSDNPKQVKNYYDEKVKGDTKIKRKVHKNIHHRKQNTNMTRLRNSGSEYDKIQTENKSVEAENILKRCFCTLKFQNRSSSEIKKQNMQTVMHFPQIFEVRRVAVQHNPKLLSKEKQIEVKSVATKMNKKDLNGKTDLKAPCNFYFCKDGITLPPEDMKTILPYVPEKFNKTVSRTVLPLETKHKKLRESMLTNRGKRLTRKRSVKYIHKTQPQIQAKLTLDKSFLGWCAKIFYPKKNNSQKNQLTENIRNKTLINATKSPKSEQQPTPNQLISNLKQRKCDRTCPYYLVYQSGDAEQWPPGISVKLNKRRIAKSKSLSKKSNTKQQITSKKKNKNRYCTCSTYLIHDKKLNKSLNMNEGDMIEKDKDRSSPLRVRFDDTAITKNKPQSEANVKSLPNSKRKQFASGTKSDRGIKSPNYCRPCRGKITKEEFHKAAGDQFFYKRIANIKSPCCSVEKIKTKIKDKMRCAMNAEKPLFEMRVDSDSNEILNRNEVIHNIAKLKTKCKPIIEVKVDPNMRKILNKRAVIDDVIASNAKMNENGVLRSIMEIGRGQGKFCPCRRGIMTSRYTKNRKPTGKPCICGSSVCAKKLESMKTPITRHKWKTCVCGSPVCDSESTKIKALSAYVENKCLCQKEMEKRKAKKLEKENKERATRLKQYKRSDKIRRNERKKEHKMLERKIDKKATDKVLFAESVLDVGKFGITATNDLLRQVARCARDPKQAIRTLRTLEENPTLLAKFIQSSYDDTGLKATLRRVRLRCLAMRGILKLRRKLESYPLTNYLMNIASKDPRRRLLKKKELPKRERERLDFNCSLYMASLRKRPYLSVYNRCPWFYSHFLSLVYAWKQFIDICLFLLAAVVWSPCILCMEICRACMCCLFCTG